MADPTGGGDPWKWVPSWALPAVLGALGGLVRIAQRKAGEGYRRPIWGPVADFTVAVFCGVLTALLASDVGGISPERIGALSGLAGHGGAVLLRYSGAVVTRWLSRATGVPIDTGPAPLDEKEPRQ